MALPKGGSTRVVSADPQGAEALVSFESFLTPPTLYFTDGGQEVKPVKSLPERFDASKLTAEQHWATSSDGTQIPYFVVHAREATGPRPTILYGYGGFEIALKKDEGLHTPLSRLNGVLLLSDGSAFEVHAAPGALPPAEGASLQDR